VVTRPKYAASPDEFLPDDQQVGVWMGRAVHPTRISSKPAEGADLKPYVSLFCLFMLRISCIPCCLCLSVTLSGCALAELKTYMYTGKKKIIE